MLISQVIGMWYLRESFALYYIADCREHEMVRRWLSSEIDFNFYEVAVVINNGRR